MNNKMKEVAKLLGVEFEKNFKIEGYEWDYRINQKGLYNESKHKYSDEMLAHLLRGSERVRMDNFLEKLHNKFKKEKMVVLTKPRGCNVSWLLQKFNESQMASPSPIFAMNGINTNDGNENAPEVELESTNAATKGCQSCYYDLDWDNDNHCVDCIDKSRWRPRETIKCESPEYSVPVSPQKK